MATWHKWCDAGVSKKDNQGIIKFDRGLKERNLIKECVNIYDNHEELWSLHNIQIYDFARPTQS